MINDADRQGNKVAKRERLRTHRNERRLANVSRDHNNLFHFLSKELGREAEPRELEWTLQALTLINKRRR